MKTDDFDYYLPEELIAQVPLEHREESRLLVMDRDTGKLEDKKFYNIVDSLVKWSPAVGAAALPIFLAYTVWYLDWSSNLVFIYGGSGMVPSLSNIS